MLAQPINQTNQTSQTDVWDIRDRLNENFQRVEIILRCLESSDSPSATRSKPPAASTGSSSGPKPGTK